MSPAGQLVHVVFDALEPDRNNHSQHCCQHMQMDSSVCGLEFDGGWKLKECKGEVTMDFCEPMISGDTITTAAGNTLTVWHDCRSNTISFAGAVGRLCEDGTLSVSSNSGTSVYHRFDLTDPEELALLQGQWHWQDEDRPSDTSLLTIRGACWHIDNGQSESWGLLHRRTSDGAVTLNTCHLHTSSRGQLKLRLPIGSTFCFSRRPQRLMSIREESNEEMNM